MDEDKIPTTPPPSPSEPSVPAPSAPAGPEPGGGRALGPVLDGWRRVSPKYLWADLLASGITFAILLGVALVPLLTLGHVIWWILFGAVALIAVLTLALTPRRVRAIGYALREDDLVFRRGILVQRIVAVPYGRMQLVDITRGPIARSFGLAELKLVTAAASSHITIPGLDLAAAEELRDRLVELAESRRAGL